MDNYHMWVLYLCEVWKLNNSTMTTYNWMKMPPEAQKYIIFTTPEHLNNVDLTDPKEGGGAT